MRFSNPYLDSRERIDILERWIIIESILYYELSNSLVSDAVFDTNVKQFLELIKAHQKDFKSSMYYYIFYDFDGATGFHLYSRLNQYDSEYLMNIAQHVLKLHKKAG